MKLDEVILADVIEIKKSVEFFLKSFSEDATVRVSKERFQEVLSIVRAKVMATECGRDCTHPLVVTLFKGEMRGQKLHIFFECRYQKIGCLPLADQPKTLDEVLQRIADGVHKLTFPTLEELSSQGLTPFVLMESFDESLKEDLSQAEFNAIKTNHPPAMA